MDKQQLELEEHRAARFPTSIEPGHTYGEVDAVLIEDDIAGWVAHERLNPTQRRSLREAAGQLARSLDAFPQDARPYYERLLRIARRAIATQ